MCNNTSGCKRIGFIVIFIFISIVFCYGFNGRIAFADNETIEEELNQNIDEILDDIDFSSLENEIVSVPNLNISFKDFVILVLNGDYQSDYNSVFLNVKSLFFEKIRANLRFFISLFVIVILFEIFKSLSSSKLDEMKSSIKIIFSFLLSTTILIFVKGFFGEIKSLIENLFSFADILFPILISLLTLSGSVKSASVFSSFSVFLLETGAFIIKYVLLPLSLSILLLSLFGSVFINGKFSKINDLFKMIFKYIIIIFFSVFGLLSTVNVISSASHDGLNLKLTKYAIKNYVPVLGGYVSDGFDFIYSCSVLIKNSIGLCAIIILIFKIISPLLIILIFSLGFKVLAVVTGMVSDGSFSDMFDDVSKSFNNFLTVVLGAFLIVFVFVFLIILSVGVV